MDTCQLFCERNEQAAAHNKFFLIYVAMGTEEEEKSLVSAQLMFHELPIV